MASKILLITANIASCFEKLEELSDDYIQEIFKNVESSNAQFVALHCQEVGGKNYESCMIKVEHFFRTMRDHAYGKGFHRSIIFLDVAYSAVDKFTALGNIYFIHKDLESAQIWNFNEKDFVSIDEDEFHIGDIESVPVKEKSKFPQEFFPECKWSRKGFMRTRWKLKESKFDLVNIHLFHDASNLVSLQSFPSEYARNRKRAMEYTLDKFHNDCFENVPMFIFGDFNFRLNTHDLVEEIGEKPLLLDKKKEELKKLDYKDENGDTELCIDKKYFFHRRQSDLFNMRSVPWLKRYDNELSQFVNRLHECAISFPPSYPFDDDIAELYTPTRCPAWCDRVLFTSSGKRFIEMSDCPVTYKMIGLKTRMGDHKPVCLSFNVPAGTSIPCCETPCPNFVHKSNQKCFEENSWCKCHPPLKRVHSDPVRHHRKRIEHALIGQSNSMDSSAVFKLKPSSSRQLSHHSSSSEEWFEIVSTKDTPSSTSNVTQTPGDVVESTLSKDITTSSTRHEDVAESNPSNSTIVSTKDTTSSTSSVIRRPGDVVDAKQLNSAIYSLSHSLTEKPDVVETKPSYITIQPLDESQNDLNNSGKEQPDEISEEIEDVITSEKSEVPIRQDTNESQPEGSTVPAVKKFKKLKISKKSCCLLL